MESAPCMPHNHHLIWHNKWQLSWLTVTTMNTFRKKKQALKAKSLFLIVKTICLVKDHISRRDLGFFFFESTILTDIFKCHFGGDRELKSLTHRILQTPGCSSSSLLWCAAGFSPGCPDQSEDSYTGETLRRTRTNSLHSGTRTGLQSYSQCSSEPPGWKSFASSLARWLEALLRGKGCKKKERFCTFCYKKQLDMRFNVYPIQSCPNDYQTAWIDQVVSDNLFKCKGWVEGHANSFNPEACRDLPI